MVSANKKEYFNLRNSMNITRLKEDSIKVKLMKKMGLDDENAE